jgi:hypothetical protein
MYAAILLPEMTQWLYWIMDTKASKGVLCLMGRTVLEGFLALLQPF